MGVKLFLSIVLCSATFVSHNFAFAQGNATTRGAAIQPVGDPSLFAGPVDITRAPDQIQFDIKQILYNAQLWSSNATVRPQMFVDLLRTKKLLGKSEIDMDNDFKKATRQELSLYRPPAVPLPYFRYGLIDWQRCGNAPRFFLDVVYVDHKVARYRFVYGEMSGQQCTPWVE